MPDFVTRDEARARLRDYLAVRRAAGDDAPVTHLASELGVSKPCISRMAAGDAPVSPRIARAIGLQPVKGFLELE